MLKKINFNFPVYYDGEGGKEIRLLNENTVETVVMLSKGEIDSKKVRVGYQDELHHRLFDTKVASHAADPSGEDSVDP